MNMSFVLFQDYSESNVMAGMDSLPVVQQEVPANINNTLHILTSTECMSKVPTGFSSTTLNYGQPLTVSATSQLGALRKFVSLSGKTWKSNDEDSMTIHDVGEADLNDVSQEDADVLKDLIESNATVSQATIKQEIALAEAVNEALSQPHCHDATVESDWPYYFANTWEEADAIIENHKREVGVDYSVYSKDRSFGTEGNPVHLFTTL